jgi:hypothetical protein
LPIASVEPSGAARAAVSIERMPLTLCRASTTTFCPSASERPGAIRRPAKSDGPPGGDGTSSRTGRAGSPRLSAARLPSAITLHMAMTDKAARENRFMTLLD